VCCSMLLYLILFVSMDDEGTHAGCHTRILLTVLVKPHLGYVLVGPH